jgi:chromosome segregation ATPase
VICLVLAAALSGCATRADLQRLDDALSKKMDALTATVSAVSADTRAALDEFGKSETARAELLRKLKADITDTRKAVGEHSAESKQRAETLVFVTAENQKHLQAVKTDVAAIGEQVKRLPTLVAGLGQDVQALHQALLGIYKIEEAALRERLRALEAVRKQLEKRGPQVNPEAAVEPGPPAAQMPSSFYDIEDATTRERLKAVEEARKQLEQAEGRSPVNPVPAR